MNRTSVRLGAALAAGALLLIPTAAQAHVGVSSPDASREGFGKVVFRVPTESDTASTTSLRVTLPKDQPLAFVSTQAKPGWKVKVTKSKLDEPLKTEYATVTEAVTAITWTSTGDGVAPGEFDEFAFSGGPLPDAESMSFDARQTYSDGEVVNWNEKQTGDEEPEHPAPVLMLAAASDDHHGAATADTASTDEKADGEHSEASADSTDQAARITAAVAVVVAVVALAFAVRQNRRRA